MDRLEHRLLIVVTDSILEYLAFAIGCGSASRHTGGFEPGLLEATDVAVAGQSLRAVQVEPLGVAPKAVHTGSNHPRYAV